MTTGFLLFVLCNICIAVRDPIVIILKLQKNQSTRTKLFAQDSLFLHTDDKEDD